MTGPQITPGPWREGVEGNNRVYGPDCAGADSGLIAVVYKGPANRKAIAAVPAMIEALRKSHEGWANALELGIFLGQHRTSATILRDEAAAALRQAGVEL